MIFSRRGLRNFLYTIFFESNSSTDVLSNLKKKFISFVNTYCIHYLFFYFKVRNFVDIKDDLSLFVIGRKPFWTKVRF